MERALTSPGEELERLPSLEQGLRDESDFARWEKRGKSGERT